MRKAGSPLFHLEPLTKEAKATLAKSSKDAENLVASDQTASAYIANAVDKQFTGRVKAIRGDLTDIQRRPVLGDGSLGDPVDVGPAVVVEFENIALFPVGTSAFAADASLISHPENLYLVFDARTGQLLFLRADGG